MSFANFTVKRLAANYEDYADYLAMAVSLSGEVIGCAMEVHKELGCGFLEAVYERALAIEFFHSHMSFERQAPLQAHSREQNIGQYLPDFVVEGELIAELKTAACITPLCEAQLINYLAVSNLHVGLILNFGARSLPIKRRVFAFRNPE
jgi:GxxExxY protein